MLVATATSSVARPARAMLGLVLINPACAIAGSALLAGGVGGFYASLNINGGPPGAIALFIASLISGLAGIILLDSEGNAQTAHFAPVSQEQADRIGMTPAEAAAYLDELDEINAVKESVVQAGIEAYRDRSFSGAAELDAFVDDQWNRLGEALSPEALSAVQKIRHQLSHTDSR